MNRNAFAAKTAARVLVAVAGICAWLDLSAQPDAAPPAAAAQASGGRTSRGANFGALVDSASAEQARDGLHVLGATPGSGADRLGLRPGDVIVAVNGASLRGLGGDERGHALAATAMRRIIDGLPDAATVDVEIVRGGNPMRLTTSLQAPAAPPLRAAIRAAATAAAAPAREDGCGRISAFDVAPRGERLYAARILLLDGTTPGPHGTPAFRVAPGEHHLLVAENIPTQALGVGEIAALRHHASKPLTVVVEPGMTAMIAARLNLQSASDLSHGAYWDPVVWMQVAEPCR